MYESHSVFKQPKDENIKIWRYMDFTKFVSLLDRNALYFSRSDRLEDPYEGVYPKANEECFGNRNATSKLSEVNRKTMYINCWHTNEYESAAMWKLYLKSNEGIALQSTFARLKESFRAATSPIYIGEVEYIDTNTDSIPVSNNKIEPGLIIDESDSNLNIFYPFLYKRKSFEHERELRIILCDVDCPLEPVYVPVDLDKLIERIYVAPTAEYWFYELVKSIIKRYGFNIKVICSRLLDKTLS